MRAQLAFSFSKGLTVGLLFRITYNASSRQKMPLVSKAYVP